MIRNLGGVVHGKRHTYVIKIAFIKPDNPERIELNRTFEITTTDETGKKRVERFLLQQGQSETLLKKFVDGTKKSAECDFDKGVI
jgi:hypothetical protein